MDVEDDDIAVAAEICVDLFILLRYISASTGSGSAELSSCDYAMAYRYAITM
ncbi:MAG: hypothetical protein IJ998_08490 [Alistipes sp.]|nr:hypothetical protein [Alistipes sp.]